MNNQVSRHFVTIDGRWGPRQVHYRRAGAGPAVLLLHQSPQSSREMVDLMRRWALHFTLIAPDTPGYGSSDPLGPAVVPIADFAAATLEFADAIGVRRFGVYGYHTGASIGAWLAAANAERVSALAANGLAQLTDAERSNILGKYLPPLVPSWDGSHLAWLWARVREQTVFFPWHERSADTRMDLDMPEPNRLHASLMEFLRAGDNYAVAYRAAFESQPETILPGLRVPLLVTAARGDPLQEHFARYQDLPPTARIEVASSGADALERSLQHLLAHRGDDAPTPVATRPIPGRLWNCMVHTPDSEARVRMDLSGRGEPLLLLHDAGQSSAMFTALAAPLIGTRPLLVPDLPGHGASEAADGAGMATVHACADAAGAILGRLGLREVAALGQGAGACVALVLARQSSLMRPRLALTDLPWLAAEARVAFLRHGLPAIEPQWHGGHLQLAWHLLRDSRLFFPWFERSRRAARPGTPDLDERRLHLELCDLLNAAGHWQSLTADALEFPLIEALRQSPAAILLGATPDSPWRDATREAGAATGREVVELPGDVAARLPALVSAVQSLNLS